MTTFAPRPAGPTVLCQTCWALVPVSADEEHARWHEQQEQR